MKYNYYLTKILNECYNHLEDFCYSRHWQTVIYSWMEIRWEQLSENWLPARESSPVPPNCQSGMLTLTSNWQSLDSSAHFIGSHRGQPVYRWKLLRYCNYSNANELIIIIKRKSKLNAVIHPEDFCYCKYWQQGKQLDGNSMSATIQKLFVSPGIEPSTS